MVEVGASGRVGVAVGGGTGGRASAHGSGLGVGGGHDGESGRDTTLRGVLLLEAREPHSKDREIDLHRLRDAYVA